MKEMRNEVMSKLDDDYETILSKIRAATSRNAKQEKSIVSLKKGACENRFCKVTKH